MLIDKDFLLLQLTDSAFPIGSFQHSFGLESYVHCGEVCDRESLLAFMHSYLFGPFLFCDLLAFRLCFREFENLDYLLEVEARLYALTSPRELREANGKLGLRFIKTINSLGIDLPPWRAYIKRTSHPTHATAYAILCASSSIDYEKSLKAYVYMQSSSLVLNAVKLVPLSQDAGQFVLLSLHEAFSSLRSRLEILDSNSLGASCPLYEIMAMDHENLSPRFYMS